MPLAPGASQPKPAQPLLDEFHALTPAKVNAALKRHIDPKKLVIVGAGDFGEEKKAEPVQ